MNQPRQPWIKLCVVLFATTYSMHASTLTLKQILDASSKHNTLTKSLAKEALALQAKTMADTASDPFEVFAQTAHTRLKPTGITYEYTMGVSKNIKLGGIQTQERKMSNLSNEAVLLEGEKNILSFENSLKNIYHQHCLDVEKYRSLKQSATDLVKLYEKKEKAYKYQEISKTELMQITSEKNRLDAQVQELKMMQDISKQKILMLSRIGNTTNVIFSCKDIYPIREKVSLKETFSLSKEANKKRLESTKARIERYSHSIDSINISGQYANQVDANRYSIGISVPLNFSSERSEKERAAALYSSAALSYRFEQNMMEKTSRLSELEAILKSKAVMADTLTRNYNTYKNRLLPLVRKSYTLGEISVIEYLLSRQKLYTLHQELYAVKKAYYNTLFTLYTLSEKKD